MKSFKKKDLLLDLNIYQFDDYFQIHNNKVYIVVKILEDNKLDLDRFYSRVAIPGYARCSLYYMLKEIIENIEKFDENTEIGISVIAPSEPRRNIETIKKTYNNLGFDNIECITCHGITKKEYKDLVKQYPDMKGSDEYLCKDTELCSAKFEKISKILNKLKFCDEAFNPDSNIKRARESEYSLDNHDIEYAKDFQGPLLTDDDLKRLEKNLKSIRNLKGGKNKVKITRKVKNKYKNI